MVLFFWATLYKTVTKGFTSEAARPPFLQGEGLGFYIIDNPHGKRGPPRFAREALQNPLKVLLYHLKHVKKVAAVGVVNWFCPYSILWGRYAPRPFWFPVSIVAYKIRKTTHHPSMGSKPQKGNPIIMWRKALSALLNGTPERPRVIPIVGNGRTWAWIRNWSKCWKWE